MQKCCEPLRPLRPLQYQKNSTIPAREYAQDIPFDGSRNCTCNAAVRCEFYSPSSPVLNFSLRQTAVQIPVHRHVNRDFLRRNACLVHLAVRAFAIMDW